MMTSFPTKVGDSVKLPIVKSPIRYAGGGKGDKDLTFAELKKEQDAMYKRTLLPTKIIQDDRFQAQRQLKIVETPVCISVNVAREDFPGTFSDFDLKFFPSAPQAEWARFIVDVKQKLGLEFIDCIVDRMNGAPVYRSSTLRNGGQYYVRQRESSSILEIITSGEAPHKFIWPITKEISIVQYELNFESKNFEKTNSLIDKILLRPLVRPEERDAALLILDTVSAKEIVDVIEGIMHSVEEEIVDDNTVHNSEIIGIKVKGDDDDDDDHGEGNIEDEEKEKPKRYRYTYDKNVDIVNLHRIALEALIRSAMKGAKQAIAVFEDGLNFIVKTLENFREEVDIVVIGFKLIGDLSPYLGPKKREIISSLLDCIQAYAPKPPIHRRDNRLPPRLRGKVTNVKINVEDEHTKDESSGAGSPMSLKERMRLKLLALMGEEEPREEVVEDEVMVAGEVVDHLSQRILDHNRPVRKVKRWGESVGVIGKRRTDKTMEEIMEEELAKSRNGAFEDNLHALNKELTEREKIEKKMKLREKFDKLPQGSLPPKFRVFSKHKSCREFALLQSFISLYRLIEQNIIFRDAAFELQVHEEISDIALVCQSLPRILEYIIWIINCMYCDGVEEEEEDDLESINPSMNDLSTLNTQNVNGSKKMINKSRYGVDPTINDDNQSVDSIDPLTGKIIDALSLVTLPTLDSQMGHFEITPRANEGDPNLDYDEPELPDGFYAAGDSESNITGKTYVSDGKKKPIDGAEVTNHEVEVEAEVAFHSSGNLADGIDLHESPQDEEVPAPPVKKTVTDEDRNERSLKKPADVVILALSMMTSNVDMSDKEREMAGKWLGLWDDASREFKILRQKGNNIAGW